MCLSAASHTFHPGAHNLQRYSNGFHGDRTLYPPTKYGPGRKYRGPPNPEASLDGDLPPSQVHHGIVDPSLFLLTGGWEGVVSGMLSKLMEDCLVDQNYLKSGEVKDKTKTSYPQIYPQAFK